MKKHFLLPVLFMFMWIPLVMEAQLPQSCLYNSGSWNSKTAMPEGRAMMASSVIDGKVYSTCGYYDYGQDTVVNKRTLFVYDPVIDVWDTTGTPIPYPRAMHHPGQSVVDGKWYVVGGIEWELLDDGWLAVPLARVDVYDPQTDSWELKANLPEPVGGHGICALDGKLYVTGGFSGSESSIQLYKSVYMYDPATDIWIQKADMNAERNAPVTLAYKGKIYVFGGDKEEGSNNLQFTAEVYDPEQDTWIPISSLYRNMDGGGCVVDDAIYLLGGLSQFYEQGSETDRIMKYSPDKDQWSFYGHMPASNYHYSACAVGGKIYVIGGRRDGWKVSNNVDEFELSDLILDEIIPDITLDKGETINLDLSQHFSHLDGEPVTYRVCPQRGGTVSDSLDGHMLILTGVQAGWVPIMIHAESENDESGDLFTVDVLSTGVSVQEVDSDVFQLFPNPAGNLLTIQLREQGIHEYMIYTVSGQLQLKGILTGSSHSIDISTLDRGMYFLKVSSTKLAVTKKFLKLW